MIGTVTGNYGTHFGLLDYTRLFGTPEFVRRFAGKIEMGKPGRTDPGNGVITSDRVAMREVPGVVLLDSSTKISNIADFTT
jgi:hypothetical protein